MSHECAPFVAQTPRKPHPGWRPCQRRRGSTSRRTRRIRVCNADERSIRTCATVATHLGVVMMKGYWMCCVRKREWSLLCGEATRYCTLSDQALALSIFQARSRGSLQRVAPRTRACLSRQGRPQHVLVNSQFRFMLYRGNKEMGLSVLRVFRKACLSLPQVDMRSLVNSRAVLVNAPLRDGARWLQSRGFIAGVLQE